MSCCVQSPSLPCRLNELIPRDCDHALAGVVRQLQRGIDEPDFRDGVMRPKRMVILSTFHLCT